MGTGRAIAVLLVGVGLGAVAVAAPGARAQGHSVVACRNRSGDIVPCADDSGGSTSSYTGGCNVICQGIRGVFALMAPPEGPSAADVARSQGTTLNNEGVNLVNAGFKRDGLAKFAQAIAIDPSNPVAQSNYFGVLAEEDMLAGRFESSLVNSRRALGFAQSATYSQYGNGQATQIANIQSNIRLVEGAIAAGKKAARQEFTDNRNELLGEVRHLGGPQQPFGDMGNLRDAPNDPKSKTPVVRDLHAIRQPTNNDPNLKEAYDSNERGMTLAHQGNWEAALNNFRFAYNAAWMGDDQTKRTIQENYEKVRLQFMKLNPKAPPPPAEPWDSPTQQVRRAPTVAPPQSSPAPLVPRALSAPAPPAATPTTSTTSAPAIPSNCASFGSYLMCNDGIGPSYCTTKGGTKMACP